MKEENKPQTSLLSLFLISSLIFFGLTLYLYFNKVSGGLIIIVPIVYQLLKKRVSTKPIDELLNKIFNSGKLILTLSILLCLIGLVIIITNENNMLFKEKNIIERKFGGIIWDEGNEALSDVIITIPELNLLDTTDIFGRFSFVIKDTNLISVSVIAQKEGYYTYEAEGSVGNTSYNFSMKEK